MRKIIFWMHFAAGLIAGVIILVMCLTGAIIAFEKDAIAIADRTHSAIENGQGAPRLPLQEIIQIASQQHGFQPSSITVYPDPRAAWVVSYDRTNVFYANPFTGALVEQPKSGIRGVMRKLTEWHRWLGRNEKGRALGKAITGACNGAFLFMAISGLYLWMPRQRNWATMRGIVFFRAGVRGKARDWNWHNVLGFWTSPVLIVLTATGLVMSYRWANDLVFKISQSPVPAPGAGSAAMNSAPPELPEAEANAKLLDYEALFVAAKNAVPNWKQFEFRLAPNDRVRSSRPETQSGFSRKPLSIAYKESSGSPSFATGQLWLDPFTGVVLRKDSFLGQNAGRRVRTWIRFLHTGEAFGIFGKIVAAEGCIGGIVLGWTGFSLALRRVLGNVGAIRKGAADNMSSLKI